MNSSLQARRTITEYAKGNINSFWGGVACFWAAEKQRKKESPLHFNVFQMVM